MNTEPNQPQPSQETESKRTSTLSGVKRPTIAELEKMIDAGQEVHILPDGTVVSGLSLKDALLHLKEATDRIADLVQKNESLCAQLTSLKAHCSLPLLSFESRLSACEAENKELVEALELAERLIDASVMVFESQSLHSAEHDLRREGLPIILTLRAHAARQKEGAQP